MNQCPCLSGKNFEDCCGRYLQNKENAPTAEALMRARYSAFTLGDVDYILSSHHPQTRDEVNIVEIKEWAVNSTWMGLEILECIDGEEGDPSGKIEFIATYKMEDGIVQRHHELSDFDFFEGKWYFTDGKLRPAKSEKIGRNDPCPCGSGTKFKKCCGR